MHVERVFSQQCSLARVRCGADIPNETVSIALQEFEMAWGGIISSVLACNARAGCELSGMMCLGESQAHRREPWVWMGNYMSYL